METLERTARVVIVGAGHAGGRMAEALREAGHVGPLVLAGGETHPPYQRPPLSKEILSGTLEAQKTWLRPLDWYVQHGIELCTGSTAVEIEREACRVRFDDGRSLAYDRLVLATGARARRLNVPGADGPNVFTLRGIDDALAVRRRIVAGGHLAVVGAGFIGLEVAAAARRCGMAVTVLEMAPHPLARMVASDFGFFFADLHQREGVEIRTGVRVDSIDSDEHGARLYMADGVTVQADAVVIGIGAQPNVELAAEAGLTVDDGILTDAWGRSSDARILAVGDVSRHFNPLLGRHVRLESWHNAQSQAQAVARAALGDERPYAEVPWFWTDQYDINVQIAGAPVQWDSVVTRGERYRPGYLHVFLAHGVPVGAIAINNGRDMRWLREMIAQRTVVDAQALADPACRLQSLMSR